MKTRPFQPPRGCFWPSLICGGLCLLIGGLSILAIPGMWRRSQEEWTETAGAIVEPYVKTGERGGHTSRRGRRGHGDTTKTTYQVRLKFRYTIAGQDFAGDAPALRQPEDDQDTGQAQAIRRTYPAGDRLAVFYDPTNGNQSRLTLKEPRQEFVLDVFFSVAFLLCGGGFIAFGRWSARSLARAR